MGYLQSVIGQLSPGQSTSIADVSRTGGLEPSAAWHANIHRYRLYQGLMLGGHHVLEPRVTPASPIDGAMLSERSWLLRQPGEMEADKRGNDVWDLRRHRSAHDPIAARIIWVYVDFLFRQAIDRSSVLAELGVDIMRDVDGRGTDAEDWLPSYYAWGLSQGWAVALIDKPALGAGAYASALHEQAAGLRPTLSVLLPERFYELDCDDRGVIRHAIVQESADRFREWTGDRTRTLTRQGEELEPWATHYLDRPPMEMICADDPDPSSPLAPMGESAMRATALVDLQVLQHMSLLDDVVRKSGFPFLHVRRDPVDGAADDVYLGADYIFQCEADVEWIAPPRDLIEALWLHIDHLEEVTLKIGGVHRRSQQSVEAHSGLALDWESAPIYATVHRWARRLREAETRIWRLMAIAMGKDPSAIEVVYPDDYSTRPAEADMQAARDVLAPWGDAPPEWACISAAALQRRAVRRLIGGDPDVREAMTRPLMDVSAAVVADDGAAPTDADADAAATDQESLEFRAKMLEQLVKARAPQPVGRALLESIAAGLDILTDEVRTSIGEAMLEWYTTPPEEVGALAELQGEAVPGRPPEAAE